MTELRTYLLQISAIVLAILTILFALTSPGLLPIVLGLLAFALWALDRRRKSRAT